MIIRQSIALNIALSLAIVPIAFADQAVLIGGGYDLHSSKAQIEEDMLWAQDSLESLGIPTTVYFTDGDDPAEDVHYISTGEEYNSPFEAISRVYGEHLTDRIRSRNHNLKNVVGSTNAEELKNGLSQFLSEAEQSTLLLFNGHGTSSNDASHQAGITLWNNSNIKADELQSVLKNANKPIRYVFSQCYSGGFNSMVFDNPTEGLTLSGQQICGVTASSPYRTSEACSAQLDGGNYRDYATFMIAAVSGYDRKGEILPRAADMDNDGLVSLREAHMFSMETAFSTDIAYASSDYYLERWQPWYLKWLPTPRALPNNEFARVFRALASEHNMPLEGNVAKTIRSALTDAEQSLDKLIETYLETKLEQTEQQQAIKLELEAKWPALGQPYTNEFKKLISGDSFAQISQWVSQHSGYDTLIELQTRSSSLNNEMLEAERYAAQLEKMLHMRKLAHLKQQLYQQGSFDEIASYERLIVCEKAPISK